MGYHHITSQSSANRHHFICFLQGQEQGLTYMYRHLAPTMRRYGYRIVPDEFVVNTLVQEAFLKLWAFRERMTGPEHIARFLKLTMRWECLAYYRHPAETFYRRLAHIDWVENVPEPLPEEDTAHLEDRLRLARTFITQVPGQRPRQVLTLHIKEGLSIPQIAQRLHSTPQAVTRELHQGLAHLRAVLAKRKTPRITPAPPVTLTIRPIEGLDSEQTHIVTMRREMRYSFGQIADLLKLEQGYVQRQYVAAWKVLSAFNRKDARDATSFASSR